MPGAFRITMPATIVNLFPIPPAPPLPGLAMGGVAPATPAATPPSAVPPGTTPPVNPPPVGGPPVVTSLPAGGNNGDQVILNGVLYQFWVQLAGIPGFWSPVISSPPALQDIWANRANYPAANYVEGTTILYTDRTVVYIVQSGAWVFWSLAMTGLLADLPNDLGPGDAGFHFLASDCRHLYLWAGSAWNFDPLDAGSGFTILAGGSYGYFQISTGLWGLCDGSSYLVAQDDGTTASVTPAVAANTYIRR